VKRERWSDEGEEEGGIEDDYSDEETGCSIH